MNIKLLNSFLMVFVFGLSVCFGQKQYWKTTNSDVAKKGLSIYNLSDEKVTYFNLTHNLFKQDISEAPLRGTSRTFAPKVTIPTLDGLKEFSIFENQIMAPELAERFPNIKSYIGFNDSGDQLFMSVSPEGVQTMVNYLDKQSEFMMPVAHGSSTYVLYNRDARASSDYDFVCSTIDELSGNSSKGLYSRDANDQTLRTYRLAVSVNGEYTTYHGGTVAGALAAINATMTRVNAVFETDMAINFQLIGNTDDVIYTDAGSDPYSGQGGWSSELQNTLTTVIGEANYDIGHFFGSAGGGGFAGCIGCVCQNGIKGSAYTSPADGIPEGDSFDIDYVAHEIGHQMGANHTWSMGSEGTGVNVEPGSGTTIMGYAGITGANDVQQHSDAYFHYVSISQILNNVNTAPNNCAVTTDINNAAPIADAGENYVIPNGTAFILKGAATDTDSEDMLTYSWEQLDDGVTDAGNFGPTKATGAVWRSRPPSTSADRYMPILERVLDGQLTETNPAITGDNSSWETVSTIARNLNFGLTVRDRMVENGLGQGGQSDFDTMQVTVSGSAGPFAVTSQTENNILWSNGTTETITWDVAGTTANGVNTANVNILLSTDGGQNFDIVLATNTPNDGSEDITVPNTPAPFCRIKIEAVDNIFYAVNPVDFPIDYEVTTSCTEYASAENLGLDIPDGAGPNQQGPILSNTINIPSNAVIDEVRVNVDVTHTYVGDLVMQLNHPDGENFVTLWGRACNSAQFGNIDVTFQDGASAISCDNPTQGTYAPTVPLNGLQGLDAQGDWSLIIADFWNADTGTLNDWTIELCTTTVTALSINEFALDDFGIFPNPNSGSFNIKFNNAEANTYIKVYDVRGRLIYNNDFDVTGNFNENVTLKNAHSGMYIVNVKNGNRTITKKIVIE